MMNNGSSFLGWSSGIIYLAGLLEKHNEITMIISYLMQRTDSLEKTLMLEKIEGSRRGWLPGSSPGWIQGFPWEDDIGDWKK